MPWTHRSFWVLPLILAAILGTLAFIFSRGRLRSLYAQQIAESRRERLFLASVGFFVTIVVVRGLTLAIHFGIGPFHDVSVHGRHIHHLVWGIILLLTVGYGWLLKVGTGALASNHWMGRLMSMLYGVAAALTLDEFALWLNLRDVYWQREGRESFEAIAFFAALLCIGIFGKPLIHGIVREILSPFRRAPRG